MKTCRALWLDNCKFTQEGRDLAEAYWAETTEKGYKFNWTHGPLNIKDNKDMILELNLLEDYDLICGNFYVETIDSILMLNWAYYNLEMDTEIQSNDNPKLILWPSETINEFMQIMFERNKHSNKCLHRDKTVFNAGRYFKLLMSDAIAQ